MVIDWFVKIIINWKSLYRTITGSYFDLDDRRSITCDDCDYDLLMGRPRDGPSEFFRNMWKKTLSSVLEDLPEVND